MATNREAFDRIAESWYGVRHWPLLRRELEEMAVRWRGARLLNVGCAHGADFLPFRQGFDLWGVDTSPAMLRQALRYSAKQAFYANLITADALALPFREHTFDWAISVATYHHIQGESERVKAFAELRRVLRPGGEALITVWNHGQPRFWLKSKEQQVPWRLKQETVYRYYHLFSYRELRRALEAAGWEIVRMVPEKSYRMPVKCFSRNICVLVRNQEADRL
jgi:tRNA (uracil-5-)-methyltransferase TRM9